MKLYHGTTEKVARLALTEGLAPRGFARRGNWEHSIDSNPDQVYLTRAYAGYFAFCACQEGERWAILEIETDLLDPRLLRPDEDALAQVSSQYVKVAEALGCPTGLRKNLRKLTEWFRNRSDSFGSQWPYTLRVLGNCAYKGQIPPAAIIRAVAYDPESNVTITLAAADPCISTLNFLLVGKKYVALCEWFFGKELLVEEFLNMPPSHISQLYKEEVLAEINMQLSARSGVEILK